MNRLLFVLFACCSFVQYSAAADFDIRLESRLSSYESDKGFSLSLKDCSSVSYIIHDGKRYDTADAVRDGGGASCRFTDLSERFAASHTLEVDVYPFRGDKRTVSENFYYEDEAPGITLIQSGVSAGGQQEANLSFEINDNVDVSYISLEVLGLKASEIRNAGGVINAPGVQPFIQVEKVLYPVAEDDSVVNVNIPFTRALSDAEITGDGILIINAEVVDSSGNTASLSEFRYTGDSIDDELMSIRAPSDGYLITSMLDLIQVIPVGTYKFRGEVPLLGGSTPVSFSVSDDTVLGVTDVGVLFPRREVNSQNLPDDLFLTIRFPGQNEIDIPVRTDFSRSIRNINFTGYPEINNGSYSPVIFAGLNRFHELPGLTAVYDDGTTQELPSGIRYSMAIDSSLDSVVELRERFIMSRSEISSPAVMVNVTIDRFPDRSFSLPVVFEDASPEIRFDAPGYAAVGDVIELSAAVKDDVRVKTVEFYQNGALLASRDQAPYLLTVNATESMSGAAFEHHAVVTDSAGQQTRSQTVVTRVGEQQEASRPGIEIESPSDAMPVIEQSRFWFRGAYELGPVEENSSSRSNIHAVRVYLDDELAGESRFPSIDIRGQKKSEGSDEIIQVLYEVWQIELQAPQISTHETSVALRAEYELKDGTVYKDGSRLIRVLQNNVPVILFDTPEADSEVTAGQTLTIAANVLDDTLYQGTRIQLDINGERFSSRFYTLDQLREQEKAAREAAGNALYQLPGQYKGALTPKQQRVVFTYDVPDDAAGDEIELRFHGEDVHGEKVKTRAVRVIVRPDQAPGVVMTSPVNGQYITEGESISVSASGTDDIGVDTIELYVNDLLLESGKGGRINAIYNAPDNIQTDQVVEFYARVKDTAGNVSDSQIVQATLGHDEQPPVFNWTSPAISGTTEGGQSLVNVPEKSTQILKLTGIDNVGVESVSVSGVKSVSGTGYVLSGDSSDVVSIEPTLIANTLNQFSALLFFETGNAGVSELGYRSYPVTATATDKNGNRSEVSVVVRVQANEAPEITGITLAENELHPADTLSVTVTARDDVAVSSLVLSLFKDGQELEGGRFEYDADSGFVPRGRISFSQSIDLSAFSLPNENTTLTLKAQVSDNNGVPSESEADGASVSFDIVADSSAPVASIISPLRGSTLLKDSGYKFEFSVSDSSDIRSWSISAGNSVVKSSGTINPPVRQLSGFANITPSAYCGGSCNDGESFEVTLRAEDGYGNASSAVWEYTLRTNNKPEIIVRQPAAGATYYEGEAVQIAVLARDDTGIRQVGYRLYRGDVRLDGDVELHSAAGENEQSYYTGTYRVATQGVSDNNADDISVRVYAIDDQGQETEKTLDLIIRHDDEKPVLSVGVPEEQIIRVRINDKIRHESTARDDRYIGQEIWQEDVNQKAPALQAIVTSEGETPESSHSFALEWSFYTSNGETEQVRLPNPGTFGDVLFQERFKRDFRGTLELTGKNDTLLRPYEGNDTPLKLVFRVTDNGGNSTDSAVYHLYIDADNIAPEIEVRSLPETYYEGQRLLTSFRISDDSAVDAYRLEVIGSDGNVISTPAEKHNISQSNAVAEYDASGLAVDVVSLLENNNLTELVLRLTATDLAGNEGVREFIIPIKPDGMPRVDQLAGYPVAEAENNSVSVSRIALRDDLAADYNTLRGGLFATTLTRLASLIDSRNTVVVASENAKPQNIGSTANGSASLEVPLITYPDLHAEIDYPEASSQGFSMISVSGAQVLTAVQASSKLRVYARSENDLKIASLGLPDNAPLNITYTRYDQCSTPVPEQITHNALSKRLDALYKQSGIRTIHITAENPDDHILKSVRLDLQPVTERIEQNLRLFPALSEFNKGKARVARLSAEIADAGAPGGVAYIAVMPEISAERQNQRTENRLVFTSDNPGELVVAGYAVDYRSHEDGRTPQLKVLHRANKAADLISPELVVNNAPSRIKPLARQQLSLGLSDASLGIDYIEVRLNDQVVEKRSVPYLTNRWSVFYEQPVNAVAGQATLSVSAYDHSGNVTTESFDLNIEENQAPGILWNKFADGVREIKDQTRLNAGEFWVRHGAEFNVSFNLSDDVGLKDYKIYRLSRNGTKTLLPDAARSFEKGCGVVWDKTAQVSSDIMFAQSEVTEYQVDVTDVNDVVSSVRFIVHPLENIQPQVRIVSPVQGSDIVSGAVNLRAVLAFTDDRAIDADDIELYVNGVRAEDKSSVPAGDLSVKEAFTDIRASLQHLYGAGIANREGIAYSGSGGYLFSIPDNAVSPENPGMVELRAVIRDADGAINTHVVTVNAIDDEIAPEVFIKEPTDYDGPIENTDFSVLFSAFDNVRVSSIAIYEGYGFGLSGNEYVSPQFSESSLIRNIVDIPSKDHKLNTTNNIDTPDYREIMHIPRINEILERAKQDNIIDAYDADTRVEYWLQFVATDSAGKHKVLQLNFPVRADEKPVVDFVEPKPGTTAVEGERLYVNLHATDDVGINYARLTAYHNEETPENRIADIRLSEAPYNYLIDVPSYDGAENAVNKLILKAEVLDTYGAGVDDPESHRAEETLTLNITQDKLPVVSIAPLKGNPEFVEGQYVPVQINASDDIGIQHVVLNVDGLISGSETLIDRDAPYEFLILMPYGQAGKSVTFTASATEQVYGETQARTVTARDELVVSVLEDKEGPVVSISEPEAVSGASATVTELRDLPFAANVSDNVEVKLVQYDLLCGDDQDVSIASTVSTTPPYFGRLPVPALNNIPGGEDSEGLKRCMFRVVAHDGAGNQSDEVVSVNVSGNNPPAITDYRILDASGNGIGLDDNNIAFGRSVVVSVIATDPEGFGVDRVELYKQTGSADAVLFGVDSAAPFNFHYEVNDSVGSQITFGARALDVDGNWSETDASGLTLNVAANKAPEIDIIKPSNNNSAIVEGESLEVIAEVADDLGNDGIERVDFYLNNVLVESSYQSIQTTSGGAAQDNQYQASVTLPEGIKGATLQAVVYDKQGLSTRSLPVNIAQVKDTVKPVVHILNPADGDIVTLTGSVRDSDRVRLQVSVQDIGDPVKRSVTAILRKQVWNEADNDWDDLVTKGASDDDVITLKLQEENDVQVGDPVSDPENFYYIYQADLSDGSVFSHNGNGVQRVLIEVVVKESADDEAPQIARAIIENGVGLSRAFHIRPSEPDNKYSATTGEVFYNAIGQYRAGNQSGDLVAAWSTGSPYGYEQDIWPQRIKVGPDLYQNHEVTGIYQLNHGDVEQTSGEGVARVFSDSLNQNAFMFSGIISELDVKQNRVLAAKSAQTPGVGRTTDFVNGLTSSIGQNVETGRIDNNPDSELLIFSRENSEGTMGSELTLAGRAPLPFDHIYGLDSSDNLALVANGNGGVIVFDISNFRQPYRTGFIKPDGFARDVIVRGNYAYVAASHQGVVVFDISKPDFPEVDVYDTFGIANRIDIEGNRLYVVNMAGDGQTAQLNVVDISDPHNLRHVFAYDILHGRQDLIADGLYEVSVNGNLAYVTANYSDQEDKPAESVIEVVDVSEKRQYNFLETRSLVTHSGADAANDASRGIAVGRNEMYIAAGRKGVVEVDFGSLTLVSHYPENTEQNLPVNLENIYLYFSDSVKTEDVTPENLKNKIRVMEQHPQFGTDVSGQFEYSYVSQSENDQSSSQIVLALKDLTNGNPDDGKYKLKAGEEYFVVIEPGLRPTTGGAMAHSFTFSFRTIVDESAVVPEIISVTPDVVSTQGGDRITIQGRNLNEVRTVLVGGQEALIESIEPDTDENANETGKYNITAITPAHYAGSASLTVTNSWNISDTAIGALTYTDDLRVSFIHPSVVRIQQDGNAQTVAVTGYGFGPDISISAYPSGSPDDAKSFSVDGDFLTLESQEQMNWLVPEFEAESGEAYRGFVTVEVSDGAGNRVLVQDALLYGRMVVNKTIPVQESTSGGLDTNQFPPGSIKDIEIDNELNLAYVLGGNEGNNSSPGWLSVLQFNPEGDDEEPSLLHGLGYYDMPEGINPRALKRVGDHVYVAATVGSSGARGEDPRDVFREGEYILVYNVIESLPGDGSAPDPDEGLDRSFTHYIQIKADVTPAGDLAIAGINNLLAVVATDGSVHVYSLISPTSPKLVRVIDRVAGGVSVKELKASAIRMSDDELFISSGSTWYVFDLTSPVIPQVDRFEATRYLSLTQLDSIYADGDFELRQRKVNNQWQQVGELNSFDFNIGGNLIRQDAVTTLAAQTKSEGCGQNRGSRNYFSLIDFSDFNQSYVLDAVDLVNTGAEPPVCHFWRARGHRMTDDGLALVFGTDRLLIIDTHLQELNRVTPADGAVGVPADSKIVMEWSREIEDPSLLEQYISLIRQSGSEQSDAAIDFTLTVDDADKRKLILTPSNSLVEGEYVLRLTGDKLSRRSRGLINRDISFSTVSSEGDIEWVGSDRRSVLVTGQDIEITLRNVDDPRFAFSGKTAVIKNRGANGKYTVTVPEGIPGPVSVAITDSGRYWSSVGELLYVEPLTLKSMSPSEGTIEGGQEVILETTGLPASKDDIQVCFGDAENLIKDADGNNIACDGPSLASVAEYQFVGLNQLRVVAPAGVLGTVDVTLIALSSKQSDTLLDAFTYQQAIQAEIRASSSGSPVSAVAIDPTATYMMVGAGDVLRILNISSPAGATTINPDDLRKHLDLDGDGIDDRQVFRWNVPGGYQILGVQGYFERGRDLVYMAVAKPSEGGFSEARLIVAAVHDDFSDADIIRELELPGDFARGLLVENNQLLVTLGEEGIGIVDVYLPNKAYLMESVKVAETIPALDLTRAESLHNGHPVYAVVSGEWSYPEQRLTSHEVSGQGGFALVSRNEDGLYVLSALDIPASDVEVQGDYAFLAAGDRGVIIVDISDLNNPRVIARTGDIGHVYDISVNGHVLYGATGSGGVVSLDVSVPDSPLMLNSFAAHNRAEYRHVIAQSTFLLTGSEGYVQVTPDADLKLFRVDPESSVLDYDANAKLEAVFRFSKSIDAYDQNADKFEVYSENGDRLNATVSINGNDAHVVLNDVSGLSVGDKLRYVVRSGLASVKHIGTPGNSRAVITHALQRTQNRYLIFRGRNPAEISIDTVSPRRQTISEPVDITVSATGVPLDADRVRVFVGEHQVAIGRIESNDDQERLAIIHGQLPPVNTAGYYDLMVEVERFGLWEKAVLRGAIAIDRKIKLTSVTPQWGALEGGTRIEITGEGFEPGSTVEEGLSLVIGSAPVLNADVISSEKIIAYTPLGNVGRQEVSVKNRYGQTGTLTSDKGFGYGLRVLSQARTSLAVPTDVYVDQETGVALGTAGYFADAYANSPGSHENKHKSFHGARFPDALRAISLDVQNEEILQVGGAGNLPLGENGQKQISRYLLNNLLTLKQISSREPLTAEERETLQKVGNDYVATNIDSLALYPVVEYEKDSGSNEYIARKRLYTANGTGGISRLNLDEQNGLQLINEIAAESATSMTTDVYKSGNMLYSARISAGSRNKPTNGICGDQGRAGKTNPVSQRPGVISYIDPNDPVELSFDRDINAGSVVYANNEWLYTGGLFGNEPYFPQGICGHWRDNSVVAVPPEDKVTAGDTTLYAVNLYDEALSVTYELEDNIRDVVSYGDYLLVALGDSGIAIVEPDAATPVRKMIGLTDLQENAVYAFRLKVIGNLLLVAGNEGSVIALDISDPVNPVVVSAGNTESVAGFDVYNHRLITASDAEGVLAYELPGSLVTEVSFGSEGILSRNDEDYLEITFNERITTESFAQVALENGALRVLKSSDTSDQKFPVAISEVQPIPVPGDEDSESAKRFRIIFSQKPEAGEYTLEVNDAANIRGTRLWIPYARDFVVQDHDALRPVIDYIESGRIRERSATAPVITVHGSGFSSGSLQARIDNFELQGALQVISDNQLQITLSDSLLASLNYGPHHLVLDNHGRRAFYPGAIMYTAEPPQRDGFELDITDGDITGGHHVTIRSSVPAIQPGTRVRMVSASNENRIIETEISETGAEIRNLEEDVISLQEMRFRAPGVTEPDIYNVYVLIPNGESEHAYLAGHFSYRLGAGRQWELPNYPPMEIGDAELNGKYLFVGVKSGSSPSLSNRFLMNSGLEVYDITIPERPIRLTQMRTDTAVNGLAVYGNQMFMAAGSGGLYTVDITDPASPLLITRERFSGLSATDLAIDHTRNVMAIAVSDPLGGGFIRFSDLKDEEQRRPEGFTTISFTDYDQNESVLQGQPQNIKWLNGALYALHSSEHGLKLTVFTEFGDALAYRTYDTGHGNNTESSLFVENGQIHIGTDGLYEIFPNTGRR